MVVNDKFALISAFLHDWFEQNKRSLPWRETTDPYRIWLSEVILQQTRVQQGLPYYMSFIHAFPTVHDLAAADLDQVLKLWQGLGYYSRARNLHKAARTVVHEMDGVFPRQKVELLKLPGVGPYTAAAVASISSEAPEAVVDGNVIRVVSRWFGITEPVDSPDVLRTINDIARTLLSDHRPSMHNQAMMEFGALQCTPKPACETCPVSTVCDAHGAGIVASIPRKSKKTKRRSRYFHYLVAVEGDHVLLEQRMANDIWQGLYQFPLIEQQEAPDQQRFEQSHGVRVNALVDQRKFPKHVLSHQDIHATFHIARASHPKKSKFERVPLSELHRFAVPKLVERFVDDWLSKQA